MNQIPILDDSHVYRDPNNSRVIPGTTSVLGEYVKVERWDGAYYIHAPSGQAIPAEIMERASAFGTAYHKGGQYLFTGQGLNWDSLNPVLVPSLRKLAEWIDENVDEVLFCEQPLYSGLHDYAGTLDVMLRLKRQALRKTKRLALIDLKSGMYDLAGPQTAAYENLYRENFKYKGFVDRFAYHIKDKETGEAELVPMTGKTDFQYFLWKLNAYRWEQARKAA